MATSLPKRAPSLDMMHRINDQRHFRPANWARLTDPWLANTHRAGGRAA